MAALTDEQRDGVRQKLEDLWSQWREVTGAFGRQDLRAAVDAIDDYFGTNAAAINAALPEPFKSEATIPQKALLLMRVAGERYGVL